VDLSPAEKEKIKRSFLTAKLAGVSETGVVEVEITNNTGKDIRDIRGSFIFEDKDGNPIYSIGFTYAMKRVFMKKDAAIKTGVAVVKGNTVFMGEHKGKSVEELLKKNPDTVKVHFSANEFVYDDGTKEEKLERIK
jgi:hypothetical protein